MYLTVLEVTSLKKVSSPAFLLKVLWEDPFSYLLQLLKAACIPWLMATHHSDLCFHHSISSPSAFVITSSSITLTLLPPSYKDPGDYIGPPTQITQDNLDTSRSLI